LHDKGDLMAKSDKEHKKQKNIKIGMAIVVIFVMVTGGVAMFADQMSQGSGDYTYNGQKFKVTEQGFALKIGGNQYLFNYYPLDLESFNVTLDIKTLLQNSEKIYISNDPESKNAISVSRAEDLLASRIFSSYGKAAVNGFSKETSFDVPIITCKNATTESVVIMFEDSDSDKIVVDGSCIHIYALDETGFYRATDRLSYSIIGVMN
jgi:hypothetical protein